MRLKNERFLPYSRQTVDGTDISAILKVLQSDLITQGPEIEHFEEKLAQAVGARYAVACNSGTAALHLACRALGLKSTGCITTSPITFLASANCAEFVNARTTFCDVEPGTWGLSVNSLKKILEKEAIDLVIPVHFAGHAVDMKELAALQKEYGFRIIEDACHALGGEYRGKKIGSCEYSDVATFSFHPVKHVTMGEGGALTTNSEEVYRAAVELRAHGVHKNPERFKNHSLAFDQKGIQNPWYYEMPDLGYNYRVTGLQAALGTNQLGKLEEFVERRRLIASHYHKKLSNLAGVTLPEERSHSKHAYHLYTLLINFNSINKSRRQVMEELRERNVGTQVLYIPVHLQPYYSERYGYKLGDFPVSESYYERCLSIPIFPGMEDDEVEFVCDSVRSVLSSNNKVTLK